MKKMSTNIFILLIILFIIPLRLLPNSAIDSLVQLSYDQKPDTVQYQRYFEISKKYSNFDLDSAIIYSQKCIEIAINLHDNKRLGNASMRNGVYYLMKNNSEKGYENLSTALEAYREINDRISMARVLNNIGIYYNEMGMLDKALESYFEAIEYWDGDNYKKSKAFNINNIGIVYLDQNNYDLALNYFNKALEIFT